MKNTVRVPRTCDPARLHAELLSYGVNVLTVRGDHVSTMESPARCAVVVIDGPPPTNIQSYIEAHREDRLTDLDLTLDEKEQRLSEMEKL